MAEEQLEFDFGKEEKRQAILAKWKEYVKNNGIYEADTFYICPSPKKDLFILKKRVFIYDVDWYFISYVTFDEACYLISKVPEISLHWFFDNKEIKDKFLSWKI